MRDGDTGTQGENHSTGNLWGQRNVISALERSVDIIASLSREKVPSISRALPEKPNAPEMVLEVILGLIREVL